MCVQQCVLTVVYFCTHLTGVCLWRECVRVCARALDRAREQLIVPDMSALLLLCNQYHRLTDSVLLRQSSRLYCVLHCPGL